MPRLPQLLLISQFVTSVAVNVPAFEDIKVIKEGLVQYISTYAGYQYTDVFTWYLVHNILTLRLHFPAQLLWSEVLPSAAFWASCGHRCMSFVLPPGINMPSVFIAQRGSAFPLLVDLHRTLYQLTLSRFRRRNKTKHKGLVCKYTSRA